MRESLSDIESRMGWEDLGDPSHHGYPGHLTLSVFPSHKVVAFIHFLSHHLILLECIFSSAFPGCFVLLTFSLGLLSYAIKSIIFKMICKTDLSLDDLCFVGGLGITAFIFRDFGVCFSHKLTSPSTKKCSDFPGGPVVKNLPCNAVDERSIP